MDETKEEMSIDSAEKVGTPVVETTEAEIKAKKEADAKAEACEVKGE